MSDGKTQEVRVHGSQASQSLGARLTEALRLVLQLARTFTGGARSLPAWQEGRRLALVPVPAFGPHPDRPPGVGGSRS